MYVVPLLLVQGALSSTHVRSTGSFVFLATAREVRSHVGNNVRDLIVKMAGLGINGVDVTDMNELC